MSQYLNIILKAPDGHFISIGHYCRSSHMYQAFKNVCDSYGKSSVLTAECIQSARQYLNSLDNDFKATRQEYEEQRAELLQMKGNISERCDRLTEIRSAIKEIDEDLAGVNEAKAELNVYEEMVRYAENARGKFQYLFGIEIDEVEQCLDETGGEEPGSGEPQESAPESDANSYKLELTADLDIDKLDYYSDYLNNLNLNGKAEQFNKEKYTSLVHKLFDFALKDETGDPVVSNDEAVIDSLTEMQKIIDTYKTVNPDNMSSEALND